jgi:hypothetical protein
VYVLIGIVLSPVVGLLTDRVGRRRVLVPSLFVFSAAWSAVALGPSFPVVLTLRVVQGTAAAGIFVTTVTVVGGALAAVSWSTPFLVHLLGFPVTLVAYRALPEPPGERERRGIPYVGRVAAALSVHDAPLLYGAAFAIELLLFGAVITALPFLLFETYGLSLVQIALVITAAEAASAVAATQSGRVARRRSDDATIGLGVGCVGVGLVGAWAAPSVVLVGTRRRGVGADAPLGRRRDERPGADGDSRRRSEPPEQHDVPRPGGGTRRLRGPRSRDGLPAAVARRGRRGARLRAGDGRGDASSPRSCRHAPDSSSAPSAVQTSICGEGVVPSSTAGSYLSTAARTTESVPSGDQRAVLSVRS